MPRLLSDQNHKDALRFIADYEKIQADEVLAHIVNQEVHQILSEGREGYWGVETLALAILRRHLDST